MSTDGETLRALREEAGLSLAALARRAHFSESHLCNVERGKRRATTAIIKAYREALPAARRTLPDPGRPPRRRRAALAARRRQRGLSQEGLAEALDLAVSTVARWEQGAGSPLPSLRRPLAEALEVSLDELDRLLGGADDALSWVAGEAHVSPGEEGPTNRRDALKLGLSFAAAALVPETAPRLGAADVERLRAEVRELYLLDRQHGGGFTLQRALGRLRETRQLLSTARYGSTTGRRLQAALGELAQEAGFIAFDAGEQETARRLFTEALCIGELADSAPVKTLVFASMTVQAVQYGDPREAVELADAAQRAARPVATPKLSSALAARQALAYARRGDPGRCGAALAAAERVLDEGADPEDVGWLDAWGPPNLYEAVARAHLFLGSPEAAVEAARAAFQTADPTLQRNRAMYQTSLAQALAAAGEVDEAAAVASDALDGLDAVSSERVRDRLRAVRPALEPHAAVPGVGECVDRLARV